MNTVEFESDPSFWSQVLKRWSDASTSVVRLKVELDQLREERNKLQERLDKPETQPEHLAGGQHDNGVGSGQETRFSLAKLNELEAGIGKAQERYHRLEEQLNDNAQKIRDLLSNNERLQREREVLEGERDELCAALKRAEADLNETRSQNAILHDKIHCLSESLATNSTTLLPSQTNQATLRNEIQDIYQPKLASLERELETLRKSFHSMEAENRTLRQELVSTRESLQKYKQAKKALPETVITSLRGLTRNMSRPYRESTIPSTSGNQPNPTFGTRPAQSSAPRVAEQVNHLQMQPNKGMSSEAIDAKTPTTDLFKNEDLTIVEDSIGPPVVSAALPSFRQQEISTFPIIIPAIDVNLSDNAFSREFMTNALGGSIQPLIVRVARQSTLSKKRGVTSYLCPGLDHNPWCPPTPGNHGYIFVGLGREKDTFVQPEIHNVFVGLPKPNTKDNRRFRYLGKYRAVRVNSLTAGEWASLSDHVKSTYAKTTKAKTKDPRTVERIIAAYDEAELYVPCVQLQCIGFDEELYTTLVIQNANRPSEKVSYTSRTGKRVFEDYEADDDCTRKRRTVRKLAS